MSDTPKVPLVGVATPPVKSQAFSSVFKKKEEKKKSTLLLLCIMVLVFGVLGYFFYPKIAALTEGAPIVESQKKVQIKEDDWQKKVFGNPVFTSLRDAQTIELDTNLDGGNPSPFSKKIK